MVSLKHLPSWIKSLPFFPVLIVYVFITSGCIITLLCLIAQLVWLFDKTLYRRIIAQLAYFLFGQMIWICIDWADTQVTLFGSEDDYRHFGKVSCLTSCSHRGDFDWLIGLIVLAKYDFLQYMRSLPKNSVKYVPGFGQLLWALECPFLNRSWQKDEVNIRKGLKAFADYPFPINVCIFCEGTRFTDAKYQESVEYAIKNNITPLKYHLLPRTKGYAILADSLKKDAHFEVTYDVGFAYPSGQKYFNGKSLTFRDILAGNTIKVFFYMRSFPMSVLPDSMDKLQTYCHQLYVHKDEAYQYFVDHGTYPSLYQKMKFTDSQLWKLRLNVVFWVTITFVLPMTYFVTLILSNVAWIGLGVVITIASTLSTFLLLLYARTSQMNNTKRKSS